MIETLGGRAFIETLETRQVFAAPTLNPLADLALASGAPSQVALDGNDADGDTLQYSVSSSNPNIIAELHSTSNRILRLEVSFAGDGVTPAFSGVLEFMLFEDMAAPVTARIIQLTQSGFYDGLIFHRVIPNFVIQGGDPSGNGTGGSGVNFDDYFNADLQHTSSGLLSMAKSFDDTNDSQFFITDDTNNSAEYLQLRNLDFNHSIFGKLVEGDDIREKINNVQTGAGDKPTVNVIITKATIVQNTDDQVLTVKAADGYTGSGTITVNVSDGNGGTTQRTFNVNATPDTVNNVPFFKNLPTAINGSVGATTNVQLQSTDVDAGTQYYYASLENAADASKVSYTINRDTGVLTVTPQNGFTGTVNIFVFVTQDPNVFNLSSSGEPLSYQSGKSAYFHDTQSIPITLAPTGVDLLDASDTGASASDNLTKLNNSSSANALTFRVSGVTSGMTVGLYDGDTLIGQAVATGTTVDITTNGAITLTNGAHNITARQSTKAGTVAGGSPALTITVDAASPVFTSTPITQFAGVKYTYDAQTDQEVPDWDTHCWMARTG
ncbi:MAG: peptidylprolyl isomerase [Pirellulales bacterium]